MDKYAVVIEYINYFDNLLESLPLKYILIPMVLLPSLKKICSFLARAIRYAPHYLYIFLMSIMLYHKRRIKRMRWDSEEITFQSIRDHAYFVLWVGSIFFYLLLIIQGPLGRISDFPYSVRLFIYSPMFALEAMWLVQHIFTRELIRSRAKIRMKSKRGGFYKSKSI